MVTLTCYLACLSLKIVQQDSCLSFLLLNEKQEEAQEIESGKQCSEQKGKLIVINIPLFIIYHAYLMPIKLMIISLFNAH